MSRVVVAMHVRNEELFLPRCLDYLATQGVDVAILDNESTDRTPQIIREYGRDMNIHREEIPYKGFFDLTSIMDRLGTWLEDIDADWFVLNSPDEILQSDSPGETMSEALMRVDDAGFNVVNFFEYVFIPENETISYAGRDYYREMRHYYYFAPRPVRSTRAWKKRPGVSPVGGGHSMSGDDHRLYPTPFVHRHYVCLSLDHFKQKYGTRSFAPTDLDKGWHGNRRNISFDTVRLPDTKSLKRLPPEATPDQFDSGDPWPRHFWER